MKHNKMGFISIILFGINAIIGSGIFLLPNQVYEIAGNASLFIFFLTQLLFLQLHYVLQKPQLYLKVTGDHFYMLKRLLATFGDLKSGSLNGLQI